MTIVLDAHGLAALAAQRAYLEELRRRGEWPAIIPSVVLTEALTGERRRDYHENRLLRTCEVRSVDEVTARAASALRTRVGSRRPPSAVDASWSPWQTPPAAPPSCPVIPATCAPSPATRPTTSR